MSVPSVKFGCSYCKKYPSEGEKFKYCGKCRLAVYCSTECQKQDWPGHKNHCTKRSETVQDNKEAIADIKELLQCDNAIGILSGLTYHFVKVNSYKFMSCTVQANDNSLTLACCGVISVSECSIDLASDELAAIVSLMRKDNFPIEEHASVQGFAKFNVREAKMNYNLLKSHPIVKKNPKTIICIISRVHPYSISILEPKNE